MKQLQVILTIDVDNDQFSQIMNDSLSIESLIYTAIENGDDSYSLDFPAVLIPKFANEQT